MQAGGSSGSGCWVSGPWALFLLCTSSFGPPLELQPQQSAARHPLAVSGASVVVMLKLACFRAVGEGEEGRLRCALN